MNKLINTALMALILTSISATASYASTGSKIVCSVTAIEPEFASNIMMVADYELEIIHAEGEVQTSFKNLRTLSEYKQESASVQSSDKVYTYRLKLKQRIKEGMKLQSRKLSAVLLLNLPNPEESSLKLDFSYQYISWLPFGGGTGPMKMASRVQPTNCSIQPL